MSAPPPMRVAVVGAGAAGAAAARRLATLGAHVTIFDQAEGGPGGRASARPIARGGPDPPLLADHGAQFLRDDGCCADLGGLLATLASSGHASPWAGRVGRVRVGGSGGFSPAGQPPLPSSSSSSSFFGLVAAPSSPAHHRLWVGTPHMDGLVAGLADAPGVRTRWGARVSGLDARPDGTWGVRLAGAGGGSGSGGGSGGEADSFDGVVLADASCARPSAPGRVEVGGSGPAAVAAADLLARVGRATARIPLFAVTALLPSAYVAAPFDAAEVVAESESSDPGVSVIVRDSAKPGRPAPPGGGEAWVAVSTPAAAARLMAAAPLSGGRPPASALEAAAAELWAAAARALVAAAGPGAPPPPLPAALRAQRWGAGLETGRWEGGGARCASALPAARVAVCGDLFHGGDGASLAAAIRSGLAAADAIGGAH